MISSLLVRDLGTILDVLFNASNIFSTRIQRAVGWPLNVSSFTLWSSLKNKPVEKNIMYDLDHMLNGKGSREHHQNMIRQAQQAKFAREVKPSQTNNKATTLLRAVLTAVINLVMR